MQIVAEATILAKLGETLGRQLKQGVVIFLGDTEVHPDGVDDDRSVLVEVFAHVGKLKGGQRHKVSTDALKLIALRDAYPEARMILAFADEAAARSLSGWKARALKANGIEVQVVGLDQEDRERIEAAQLRQRMVNTAPESPEPPR